MRRKKEEPKQSAVAAYRQAELDSHIDAIFHATKEIWKMIRMDWTGLKLHPILAYKLGELAALVVIERGEDGEPGLTLQQVAEREVALGQLLEQRSEQRPEQPQLMNENGDLTGGDDE